MSAPARPDFKPIPFKSVAPAKDIDQMASAAKAVAERENIPVLTHPREVKPAGQGPSETTATPAPATRWKRFTVEVPTYLYDDIENRAKGATKKSVIIHALQKAGCYVAAEDLTEDGRRGK